MKDCTHDELPNKAIIPYWVPIALSQIGTQLSPKNFGERTLLQMQENHGIQYYGCNESYCIKVFSSLGKLFPQGVYIKLLMDSSNSNTLETIVSSLACKIEGMEWTFQALFHYFVLLHHLVTEWLVFWNFDYVPLRTFILSIKVTNEHPFNFFYSKLGFPIT